MAIRSSIISTSLAVSVVALLSVVPSWSDSSGFDIARMMPTSAVRAGMKGTARTVFSGVDIEEFNIEVLGVLPKFQEGSDVILIRILDGPVVEQKMGIFSGMSGTPVYIGGRLIGAMAFTWAFERQPIAGVTPIESMLRAFEKQDSHIEEESSAVAHRRRSPVKLAGRNVTGVRVVSSEFDRAFVDDNTLALRPVTTPIFCAGFGDKTVQHLADFFGSYGIEAIAGPGNMRREIDTELQPGAAMGVQFVSGDFDINSVGTVTYREGDRLLAFGHPLMKLGQTQLPLTTAWVHQVIAKMDFSFRMASGITPVGTLAQDTAWSIAGQLGSVPETIPATFEIHDLDNDLSHTYRVQICNDPALRQMLILMCGFDAIYAAYDANDEGTVEVSFTVEGEKGSTVSRTDTFAYQGEPSFDILWDMLSTVTLLEKNRFTPQRVSAVKLSATISRENRTATIERVWAEEAVARAGEDVTLHVLIRPIGEEATEKVVRLHMPLELPKGYLRLAVSSGGYGWMLRSTLRLLTPEFNKLETVINEYQQREQNTQLLTLAAMPTVGLRIGDILLNNLPKTAVSVISSATRTDIATGYSELSEVIDTPYVLDGLAVMMLPTEDRQGERATLRIPSRGAPPGPGGPAMPSTGESSEWVGAIASGRVPSAMWWARSAFASKQVDQPPLPPAVKQLQPEMPPMPEEIKELLEKAKQEAPGETEEEKKTEAKEEEKEADGKVIRGSSSWLHDSPEDYEDGTLAGLGVRDDGLLITTPPWQVEVTAPGNTWWSLAVDSSGTVFAGEASDGDIYAWQEGKLITYFEAGEAPVSALLVGSDGQLYAGTCGEGKIFLITQQDQGEVFCELPAEYIWDILPAPNGGLLVATGPHGLIYLVDEQGKYSLYADVPQSHVLCLAVRDGVVYAGTSAPGAVYQIGQQRQLLGVLDAGDNDIADLVSCNGALYAATFGERSKGYVYRIDSAGIPQAIYQNSEHPVLALLAADGRVYGGAASKGIILTFTDDEHCTTVYRNKDAGAILCLAAGGKGLLFAGGNNPGRLLSCNLSGAETGRYISDVLDAERLSQWQRVRWWAQGQQASEVVVHCRSGNTRDRDEGSWSSWSRPYHSGMQIDVPAGRYLQYRVQVPADTENANTRLKAIRISYLPANQKPKLKVKAPTQGAALRNKAKIEWSADDPDDDNIAATVYLRPTDGEWEQIAGPIQEDSYELDTTEQEPGNYEIKITITDRPSNPDSQWQVSQVVTGVRIDNEPPMLRMQPPRGEQEEAKVSLEGIASDEQTAIASVSWQVEDSDEWWAAQPADGAYDELIESFEIATGQLPEDAEQIVVRVWDEAGNTTDQKVHLPWISEEDIAEDEEKPEAPQEEEQEPVEESPEESPASEAASG